MVIPRVSLNTGLDSPLECGTGTWDWITEQDCGTGIVYWPIIARTDNKVRQGVMNLVMNLS